DPVHGVHRAISAGIPLAQILHSNRQFRHARTASGSDDGAIFQDGGLGDHDHAVSDHVHRMLLGVLCAALVGHPNVSADAGVLVDDRPLDHRILANAEYRPAQPKILGMTAAVFEHVNAHDVAVSDGDVLGDPSPNSDHRVLDDRAL